MPAQGPSRVGTTPPPRTAETEHLYDRGIPKAHSKAESRRRKNTAYGPPVKPSKDTPPEFWGQRLPYFRSSEFQSTSDMLDSRPKKKRKAKQRPHVPVSALARNVIDLTQDDDAGVAEVAQLPTPRQEASPVVPAVTGLTGPLPGFLHGTGVRRVRARRSGESSQSYDSRVTNPAPASQTRQDALSGRSEAEIRADMQRRNALQSVAVQPSIGVGLQPRPRVARPVEASPRVVLQPRPRVARPRPVQADVGVPAQAAVVQPEETAVASQEQPEAAEQVVMAEKSEPVIEQAANKLAVEESVNEQAVGKQILGSLVPESVASAIDPSALLQGLVDELDLPAISAGTVEVETTTEYVINESAPDGNIESPVHESASENSAGEAGKELEEEVYIAAGEDGTPEFHEEGTESAEVLGAEE